MFLRDQHLGDFIQFLFQTGESLLLHGRNTKFLLFQQDPSFELLDQGEQNVWLTCRFTMYIIIFANVQVKLNPLSIVF